MPNGENAHITVRPGLWWKGIIDSISVEYPKTKILFAYKKDENHIDFYQPWSTDLWIKDRSFKNKMSRKYLNTFDYF